MAKKGGVVGAMGNLFRWVIWGLAAVLVLAIYLGWSNQANGPDAGSVAVSESAGAEESVAAAETEAEAAAEEVAETVEAAGEAGADAASDAAETVENAVAGAVEAANQAAAEAQDTVEQLTEEAETAVEGAVAAGEEAVAGLADTASEAASNLLEGAAEEASSALGAASEAAAEVSGAAAEGVVPQQDANLNILPPELSEITIPGDDAVYGLVSVFQRDDGSIEVVSSRTTDGATVETTRLVTCAPLAAGVIAEGDGARNETPEMERISLGSAAATIAALACGKMN